MHLARLNVTTYASRSLSVIIKADLDILLLEMAQITAPQLFSPPLFLSLDFLLLQCICHSCQPLPFLRACGVPLTSSITVTHCFNVQLHMMRQAHNVLSLLIHWWTLSP